MTDQKYSKNDLLEFLKEAAVSGLMNPAVARSRKTAAQQLLEHVTPEERINLRQLDVDELCSRIHKLENSSIREEALNLYNARLKSAMEDYFVWLEAPSQYKELGLGQIQAPAQEKKRNRKEQKALESITLKQSTQPDDIIPIPLRKDLTVYLKGLPLNFTAAEADKICRVIKAYAGADS